MSSARFSMTSVADAGIQTISTVSVIHTPTIASPPSLAWTNTLVLNLWNATIFLITRSSFILAVMIGIPKGRQRVKSDMSINSNTKAFSVLLAFFGGHMVLVSTDHILHLIQVSQCFVLFLGSYLKALSADRVSHFLQEPHGDYHSIYAGCRERAGLSMKSSWHDSSRIQLSFGSHC
jgi:hypothetical protein